MLSKVHAMCFSPTHTTRTTVREVARALAAELEAEVDSVDVTLPANRPSELRCGSEDVLVFGFPVYAGRVPVLLRDQFEHLRGAGSPALVVALYGNRDFDDALVEAADLLNACGFEVAAAGAFVGEHSLTSRVGAGRPDEKDLALARDFGRKVGRILAYASRRPAPAIRGDRPYKELQPGVDVRPLTRDNCTGCGACVARCPLGVIHSDDPRLVDEGCLHCAACVKSCPEGAKHFSSESTDRIIAMLETKCIARKEPELFC